jgi:ferritin-like protein
VENTFSQPIYYLDEWFKAVGTGVVRNSTTDEVRGAKNNNSIRLQQLLEKAQGKLDGIKVLIRTKNAERLDQEKELVARIAQIADHYPVTGLPEISSCYTDTQKHIFSDVQELLKVLIKADREQDLYIKDYYQAEEDVKTIQFKIEEEGGAVEVDVKAVDTEFETVRQMAKMTIGRQGNHFPILASEYFHCQPNDVATRENVISMLAWIESIDSEAFCRSYKNRLNRIVPYVVLIPSYGDGGMCWEPYDRFNRATSRGRIAIPMYPKSLQIAVLSAVADLRWQVAKEKASYYWMEEGITGNYYQWFQKMKLKGDLKESFIQDYISWMTKESEGTQKLDKELRGAFWRYMPFSKAVKEKLKTRSYVYQELYQRDVNRSMSDGY